MQPQPPSEFFLLLEAWWLGHIWRFHMFHKKTLNFPVLLKLGCIFTGEYSTISVSSDCIFIWNYWWTLHLLQCVSDGIWCYLWIIFWQNFRCLFWTDGLMQWHLKIQKSINHRKVGWHVFPMMLCFFHCISFLSCAFLFLIYLFLPLESDESMQHYNLST